MLCFCDTEGEIILFNTKRGVYGTPLEEAKTINLPPPHILQLWEKYRGLGVGFKGCFHEGNGMLCDFVRKDNKFVRYNLTEAREPNIELLMNIDIPSHEAYFHMKSKKYFVLMEMVDFSTHFTIHRLKTNKEKDTKEEGEEEKEKEERFSKLHFSYHNGNEEQILGFLDDEKEIFYFLSPSFGKKFGNFHLIAVDISMKKPEDNMNKIKAKEPFLYKHLCENNDGGLKCSITSDGPLLVIVCGRKLYIWDTENRSEIRVVDIHEFVPVQAQEVLKDSKTYPYFSTAQISMNGEYLLIEIRRRVESYRDFKVEEYGIVIYFSLKENKELYREARVPLDRSRVAPMQFMQVSPMGNVFFFASDIVSYPSYREVGTVRRGNVWQETFEEFEGTKAHNIFRFCCVMEKQGKKKGKMKKEEEVFEVFTERDFVKKKERKEMRRTKDQGLGNAKGMYLPPLSAVLTDDGRRLVVLLHGKRDVDFLKLVHKKIRCLVCEVPGRFSRPNNRIHMKMLRNYSKKKRKQAKMDESKRVEMIQKEEKGRVDCKRFLRINIKKRNKMLFFHVTFLSGE